MAMSIPATMGDVRSPEKGRSGGPYGPPLPVGEDLRLAILERERAGCLTYPVVRHLSVPRLWQVPQRTGPGELVVHFRSLRARPLEVRPDVWSVLAVREIESVWAVIESASRNRDARAQLRRLAAAALRDICGWSWEEVVAALEYRDADDRRCRGDAARGRRHWRALRAWPWVALPAGPPPDGWEEDETARVG